MSIIVRRPHLPAPQQLEEDYEEDSHGFLSGAGGGSGKDTGIDSQSGGRQMAGSSSGDSMDSRTGEASGLEDRVRSGSAGGGSGMDRLDGGNIEGSSAVEDRGSGEEEAGTGNATSVEGGGGRVNVESSGGVGERGGVEGGVDTEDGGGGADVGGVEPGVGVDGVDAGSAGGDDDGDGVEWEGLDASWGELGGGDDGSGAGSDGGWLHPYKNADIVVDLTAERRAPGRYGGLFYKFLDHFSEEKTSVYDPEGVDDWDLHRLMLRRFEGRPLHSYRVSRVRTSVVVILDTSGSMVRLSRELSYIARLALRRGDVELYEAPNGVIRRRITSRGVEEVSHEEVVRGLVGRRILYVGDYDGGDTPVELSFRNTVVWVATESRYREFESHNWMSYREEDFRGVFVRAFTLDKAFRALVSLRRFDRLWLELEYDHVFYEDRVRDYYYDYYDDDDSYDDSGDYYD